MSNLINLNNYKVLFSLRLLKSILNTFVESFLVLYFLTLSNSNILPLGIYKIVSMFVVFITIFLLRNICKSKNRIHLLRIGIFLDLIYFLSIILLREKVVEYIYLIGILYGLEEGFYYSVFNMYESDGVTNSERARFTGYFTVAKSILSIIFPLIFGSLIATTGFLKSILVVIVIVIIRIILSFIFKDNNIPKTQKTNIKEYYKLTKNYKNIKSIYVINLLDGLTYSSGAISSIITIYIIKVFSDSFSFGVFTSIFSLISCVIGFIFARYLKKKDYPNIIMISMSLTIISLIVMIIYCNAVTIIIFNFFQTISRELTNLINGNSKYNISNLQTIRKEYKVEYYLSIELMLFIGRMISQALFILMAFVDIIYIIPTFIFFLIVLMLKSIKLQKLGDIN